MKTLSKIFAALMLANFFATTAIAQMPSTGANRVVVWNGDGAHIGAGWTNPTTSTIKPESIDVHGNKTALDLKFNDSAHWIGAGWDWEAFKTGRFGADISDMSHLTFWIKETGQPVDLQINLLCNGVVRDTPEHHTGKVHVLKYCPDLGDGKWRQVRIPLSDLTQPEGFDSKHVCEMQMGFVTPGAVSGSFILDDIAFTRS